MIFKENTHIMPLIPMIIVTILTGLLNWLGWKIRIDSLKIEDEQAE